MVSCVNSLKNEADFAIFRQDPAGFAMQPLCSVFQEYHLWGYEGIGIATTLQTAQKLLNVYSIPKKYFSFRS
jgi:hypothetical protein